MIRRERRDGGEREERELRKGAQQREDRDREKGDKRELSQQFEEEDKEHRHLPLLVSSRHCVSSEIPTRFCSNKALQQ